MNHANVIRTLRMDNAAKIVLVVADGLGGLPLEAGGKTELETARKPHLDSLARQGACGLSVPVLPGVTPRDGIGHLALFGYDPWQYRAGRGALDALSANLRLSPRDVAARGVFCTADAAGRVTDLRPDGLTAEGCAAFCQKLRQVRLDGVELLIEPAGERHFVLAFRGDRLGDAVTDTEPQAPGECPAAAKGSDADSERTAALVNRFLAEAGKLLRGAAPANAVNLGGFSRLPQVEPVQEVYGVRALALATSPAIRGVARLVGMDVLDGLADLDGQAAALRRAWGNYDLFVLHYPDADDAGRAGNFDAKVRAVERLDAVLPQVLSLGPDVLAVAGGHSTPSKLRGPSWHPAPALLWAKTCRTDPVREFGEAACLAGGLGQFLAAQLMALLLAHARRLRPYGD